MVYTGYPHVLYIGYYTDSCLVRLDIFTSLTYFVQQVVEVCNIAVYLHSKKLYFDLISCTSYNKHMLYTQTHTLYT